MTEDNAIRTASEKYCRIRKPHVEGILDATLKMEMRRGTPGVVAEYMMYFFMWVICKYTTIFAQPTGQCGLGVMC